VADEDQAGSRPLLIMGGFGGGAEALEPLRERLGQAGWSARIVQAGRGRDHGELLVQRLIAELELVALAGGEPAVVVGHSRGGQVARAATRRRPELVAQLVTLASPLNRLFRVAPVARAQVAATAVLGTLGAPGLLHVECLWASCCRPYRADLAAPFPAGVPFTSVYTRADRVVPWRTSLDAGARHVEVDSSHDRIVVDDHVLDAVVGELLSRAARP
jgi:triacylglycerol lipase